MPHDPHAELRDDVRGFARTLPEHYRGSDFLQDDTDAYWRWTRSVARELSKLGWLTMHWPRQWGGDEAPPERVAAFREVFAQCGGPQTHGVFSGVARLGGSLLAYGTPEQQRKWLPSIGTGEISCTMGNTEPQSGSDLSTVTTSAELHKDAYILNGRKAWISYAHRCDTILLLARTGPVESRHRGLSQFVVPADAPGLEIIPRSNLSGGHPQADLVLNEVVVPVSYRIGAENQGWQVLHDTAFRGETPVVGPGSARYEFERFLTVEVDCPEAELQEIWMDLEAWRRLAWRAVQDPNLLGLAMLWGKEWEPRLFERLLSWAGAGALLGQELGRYERLYRASLANHVRHTPEAIKQTLALQRFGIC